jgi:hypothetical protein
VSLPDGQTPGFNIRIGRYVYVPKNEKKGTKGNATMDEKHVVPVEETLGDRRKENWREALLLDMTPPAGQTDLGEQKSKQGIGGEGDLPVRTWYVLGTCE